MEITHIEQSCIDEEGYMILVHRVKVIGFMMKMKMKIMMDTASLKIKK